MDLQMLKVHLKSKGLGMLHHNAQLANPMNKFAMQMKPYTSKSGKKRTEEDLIAMAQIEYLGGLWRNAKNEPCVPVSALIAVIRDGLKQQKKGRDGLRALHCEADAQLIYNGPRDPAQLWADERFRFQSMEKIGAGRVLRTRPYFPQWELKFELAFVTEILDRKDIDAALEYAGDYSGIGDRRPTHGKFDVVSIKEVAARAA